MEDMLAGIPMKGDDTSSSEDQYQIMKLNVMGKKSPLLEEKQIYYKKLVDKIADK
jgi:hypothetical protein